MYVYKVGIKKWAVWTVVLTIVLITCLTHCLPKRKKDFFVHKQRKQTNPVYLMELSKLFRLLWIPLYEKPSNIKNEQNLIEFIYM